jgi:hypothetical protein
MNRGKHPQRGVQLWQESLPDFLVSCGMATFKPAADPTGVVGPKVTVMAGLALLLPRLPAGEYA